MKTRIYYGRDEIGRFNCDARRFTKWQIFCYKTKKWYKRTLLVGALVSVVGWAYVFGTMTTMAEADSKVIYVQSTSTPDIMTKVEQCESNASQLDKNGQVQIHINSNGTYDIGRFMINSIWEKQATKLGYDLTKSADNEKFAMWLYKNDGLKNWSATYSCWSK
jgi:hypothetical protein